MCEKESVCVCVLKQKKIGQEFFPAHRFELFWRRYREWETKRLRGRRDRVKGNGSETESEYTKGRFICFCLVIFL